MASAWLGAVVSALGSALVLSLLLFARRRLPQDRPGERSLHGRPTPRVGGLAIWAGFLPAAVLASDLLANPGIWFAAWLAIAAVSLADDWRGVRPAIRLAVQATAAAILTATILGPERTGDFAPADAAGYAVAVVALVWAANLYNFMDGSDGLAAVMGIGGFGAYAAAATIAGSPPHLHVALATAIIPFLVVNLPPARTFMGDVGSVPLGFLAAASGLAGCVANVWPAWFPLLVFLPFIADATVTLFARMARGERVYEAHRKHYYQRLNRLGAGHRGTLLVYSALIAGTATSAVFALAFARGAGWAALGAWIALIGLVFAGIEYHWRKRSPQ